VSDPAAGVKSRPCCCPDGVAHAIAANGPRHSRESQSSGRKSAARSLMCAQVVRESFPENLVPRGHVKWSRVERSARPLAITHSMLALCSAACKALRFASTALARGLRALTPPPRSSSTGNYVMAFEVCLSASGPSGSAARSTSENRRLRSSQVDLTLGPDT
jgi:hypothetical protein